jgi:hypothetical protein
MWWAYITFLNSFTYINLKDSEGVRIKDRIHSFMAYLYLTFAAEISLITFTVFSISEIYHTKHGDLKFQFIEI